MHREKGYYWVKYKNNFYISKWSSKYRYWAILEIDEITFEDKDFEHINENRIKQPGELLD